MDAMQRGFARVATQVGVYALVTHAKNDAAAGFYRRYGFMALPSSPPTLYLPMATIAGLYAGS